MKEVFVGTVVAPHALKGEIRLMSNFSYKEKAFQVGTHLLIEDTPYEILRYRKHKQYDMVCLDGINSIEQVFPLRQKKVYKAIEELHLASDEILDEELLHYTVQTEEQETGVISEIFMGGGDRKILRISLLTEEFLLPFPSPFILQINKTKKVLVIKKPTGL